MLIFNRCVTMALCPEIQFLYVVFFSQDVMHHCRNGLSCLAWYGLRFVRSILVAVFWKGYTRATSLLSKGSMRTRHQKDWSIDVHVLFTERCSLRWSNKLCRHCRPS